MIKIENVETFNLKGALQGMRLPMRSTGDSFYNDSGVLILGPKDLTLARKLVNAGHDSHSKFMRQILVSMDITAPLYWWKEMDTYKVATVANSESTMHRLSKTPITYDCFSFDSDLADLPVMQSVSWEFPEVQPLDNFLNDCIFVCENLRKKYVETGDIRYWRAMIQILPSSWNQTRHWTGNYATLQKIVASRENHKLTEWHKFIATCNEQLPYFHELTKGE